MEFDVLIIGGGPAGLSASVYCKRANLTCCIIDNKMVGGNPLNYSEIENYLGLGKTDTFSFTEKLKEHVALFDVPIFEFEEIKEIDLYNKTIKTIDKEFKGKYIIIATGSKPRMLNVPGESKYIGKGVHYCAICDGYLYKDKIVAVIGGGNSACEEALGLSKICKKVYIVEFTDKLNADKITLDKINNTENIEVYLGYAVTKIEDETFENEQYLSLYAQPRENFEKHEGTVLYDVRPSLKLWVSGIFPYIGMSPNLPTKDIPLAILDNYGYIIVDENMETIIPDVYAVGDITSKKYRQVITAVADGAIAAIHISKK